MQMICITSFHPVRQASCQHVVGVFGHLKTGRVKGSSRTVDMVGTGRSPASIFSIFANCIHNICCIFLVLADNLHLSLVAVGQRSSRSTTNTEDVGKGPRIIEGVDGEEGDLDERMDMFGKQAFPFLLLVGIHAFLCGRIHFHVHNCHEV